jgi:hypothetical protein
MPNERGGITKLHYAIGFNPRDKKRSFSTIQESLKKFT